MKMTDFHAELIEATEALGLRWRETSEGYLRSGEERAAYCPITAVCKARTGVRFSVRDYHAAARRIGLGQDDTAMIAEAADTGVRSRRRRTRTELKRAMGLQT